MLTRQDGNLVVVHAPADMHICRLQSLTLNLLSNITFQVDYKGTNNLILLQLRLEKGFLAQTSRLFPFWVKK
jgi:hypothetical protein